VSCTVINRIGTSIALACLTVGAANCGEVPATTPSDTTTTRSALWSIDDTTLDSKSWDGGSNSNLTGWHSVGCVDDYGGDFMIAGLKAYKEPWRNADAFVARLEATCRQFENQADTYGDIYLPTGTEHSAALSIVARWSLAVDEIASGKLEVVFPHLPPAPTRLAYYLAAPRENLRRPSVSAFWKWVHREAVALRQRTLP